MVTHVQCMIQMNSGASVLYCIVLLMSHESVPFTLTRFSRPQVLVWIDRVWKTVKHNGIDICHSVLDDAIIRGSKY